MLLRMTVLDEYDALLFDLDGTVWEGGRALPFAVDSINQTNLPLMYVTNNASRGPEVVASLLSGMGIFTQPEQVLTSAQAAIDLALKEVPVGSNVLVLGTDSFKSLAAEAGYMVVNSADMEPVAVFHGHNPATSWTELSEAALAIRCGAKYYASNLDTTLPSERGLCVGNGSMVAAVVSATGVQPVSAGKPGAAMFHVAAEKLASEHPLAVGDRLNTDIAGGVAAGFDTLHLLTGVSQHWALIHAIESERPTLIAEDLRALSSDRSVLMPQMQGDFNAYLQGTEIVLDGGLTASTSTEALRSVLSVAWQSAEFGGAVKPVSEHAIRCMSEWR